MINMRQLLRILVEQSGKIGIGPPGRCSTLKGHMYDSPDWTCQPRGPETTGRPLA